LPDKQAWNRCAILTILPGHGSRHRTSGIRRGDVLSVLDRSMARAGRPHSRPLAAIEQQLASSYEATTKIWTVFPRIPEAVYGLQIISVQAHRRPVDIIHKARGDLSAYYQMRWQQTLPGDGGAAGQSGLAYSMRAGVIAERSRQSSSQRRCISNVSVRV